MKRWVSLLVINFLLMLSPFIIRAQQIINSVPAGGISACVGTASVSPAVELFNLRQQNISSPITLTAPSGFEISLAEDAGYANTLSVQGAGGLLSTKIFVRSSASAPAGNTSANIKISTAGLPDQNVTVTATIYLPPIINPVPNQTVVVDSMTQAVHFTGTGNAYLWTSDNRNTGLNPFGYGDIPAFKARNPFDTAIVVHITATPVISGFAYITNNGDSTVSVISNAAHAVVATLQVGQTPTSASVSPDGSRVYILNNSLGTITVVNTLNNQIVDRIVGPGGTKIIVSPDNTKLYCLTLGSVTVMDIASRKQIGYIPVEYNVEDLVISPDGLNGYVLSEKAMRGDDSGFLSFLDFTTNTVTDTLHIIPTAPLGLAISHDGSKIYANDLQFPNPVVYDRNVWVIDAATHKLIDTVTMKPDVMAAMTVNPAGTLLYIAEYNQQQIATVDLKLDKIAGRTPAGDMPYRLAFSPDGSILYSVNFPSPRSPGTVSMINGATTGRIALITVGTTPNTSSNFVSPGIPCTGTPITFSITVNPDPKITIGPVTGTITACERTASTSPNLQQFSVAGTFLTGNIKAVAPKGFELSLSRSGTYLDTLILTATNGTVNDTVFVRSAAADTAGSWAGMVHVSALGFAGQDVAVSAAIGVAPLVDFTTPSICLADATAQFTNNSTISDHSENSIAYVWNFGDPYATTANNTSIQKNPQHTYTHTGNYTVTLTATAQTGCVASKIKSFTVNGVNPVAAFTVQNAAHLCSADSVTFNDQSTVDFGNITRVVWYFDYNNHQADSVVYTSSTLRTDKQYRHSYGGFTTPNQQSYQVVMVAYSGQVCKSISRQTITVTASPTVTLTPSGAVVLCQGDSPLQIKENHNGFNGSGVFSGTGVTTSGLFDPKVSGTGRFVVKYVFTDSGTGCTYADSLRINVSSPPVLTVNKPVVTLPLGGQATLDVTATSADNKMTYKWIPSAGLNTDNVLNPTVSPTQTTVYLLTATTDSSCTASAKITVNVLTQGLVIPTAFTPNSDGINDRWDIPYLDTYPNSTVQVFNRYGAQVYFSRSYPTPWDGTYKGNALPDGVYYYLINTGIGQTPYSGSVTIIR